MIDLKKFRRPSARRSPGYFWSCGHDFDAAKMRIELENMVKKNVRSICLHPVPANFRIDIDTDMTPEYLSKPYFEVIKEVVGICKELGMNYYLYDEGGWPSGGACGQVWAADPEKFTRSFIVPDPDSDKGWKIMREKVNPELAAPYPNVLEKGAVEKFIELTHEAHRKYCSGHLGKTIHMAFTDEPVMPGIAPGAKLGYCSDLFEEFRRRKGYDLEEHITELLGATNHIKMLGKTAERYMDYCEVMMELFHERFLHPLRQWCRENDLLSAGHFGGEDEWFNLKSNGFGLPLTSLKQLDCPGVDVIWHQLYPGERLHPFPLLAASAAHQTGHKEVLAEMFAIYGGGLIPERMTFLLDYMLICGINTFVFSSMPHYADRSDLSGGRPSFSKSYPLWNEFDLFHTYAARMSELLTAGTSRQETALYLDQRSFLLGTRESEYAINTALESAELLRRHQRNFDFIDDDGILKARLKNHKLYLGSAVYDQLVIPEKHRMTAAARNKVQKLKERSFPVLTPDESDRITPTLEVFPATWKLLVHKRELAGGQAGYFVMNLSNTTVKAAFRAKEKTPVSAADWERAGFYALPGGNGQWEWEFAPYESKFFLCGRIDLIAPPEQPQHPVRELTRWKICPVKQHFAAPVRQEDCPGTAIPAKTGDWSKYLGPYFSGTVKYTTTFRWDGVQEINFIDLGRVCYTCEAKLNGRIIGRKFSQKPVFDLRPALKKGVNRLEITVSNTLANALALPEVQEIWSKTRKVPSPYNPIQLEYETEALPSGLFGPVRLMK